MGKATSQTEPPATAGPDARFPLRSVAHGNVIGEVRAPLITSLPLLQSWQFMRFLYTAQWSGRVYREASGSNIRRQASRACGTVILASSRMISRMSPISSDEVTFFATRKIFSKRFLYMSCLFPRSERRNRASSKAKSDGSDGKAPVQEFPLSLGSPDRTLLTWETT